MVKPVPRADEESDLAGAISLAIDEQRLKIHLLSALVIDDDDIYASNLRDELLQLGLKADVALSLDKARSRLEEREYSVVVCDNIFGDPSQPHLRGSQFILDNPTLLKGAHVILVTGFAIDQITDRRVLAERGVSVLGKSPGHMKQLLQLIGKIATDRLAEIRRALEVFCESVMATSGPVALGSLRITYHLVSRATQYLADSLRTMDNAQTEQFRVMGKSFTPLELLQEIERGSDVAVRLVDMFLDDLLED